MSLSLGIFLGAINDNLYEILSWFGSASEEKVLVLKMFF